MGPPGPSSSWSSPRTRSPFGALVVTGARLGDVLGRRRAFVLGLGAFTACSLAGGLAPDPALLIVARGFQGAAAALMTPQVLSIIQVQFDGERRARAIGAYSMILAVGVAAGQILGGLLVTAHLLAAAWRPALLLNVPIGVPLLAVSRRVLPPMAPFDEQRLDLAGAGLLAAAMVALVVPLSFGRAYGWPLWAWLCLAPAHSPPPPSSGTNAGVAPTRSLTSGCCGLRGSLPE